MTLYERSTNDPEWESIYDHPERISRKTKIVDGYQTAYIESGKPGSPPLVLIHGANFQTGVATDRWYPTILPLARHFHVFAVDELGGGGTDAPRDLRDLGHIRVRAEHVIAFIDSLGVGPCHLVGQSQGAWIAAYVALRRPDLLGELVLVDSASLALPAGGIGASRIAPDFSASFAPGTLRKEGLKPDRESLIRYVRAMIYDESMICEPFLDRVVKLSEKWLPIWEEPWKEFWADGGKRNREQYLMDGTHVGELVSKIDRRPLVIWGNNSAKGVENGLDFYRQLPDAQFHVFDKANHFLWLDQWKEFNSLVIWFLSRKH